jgi:oligopeptide transport system substrate-binding protein
LAPKDPLVFSILALEPPEEWNKKRLCLTLEKLMMKSTRSAQFYWLITLVIGLAWLAGCTKTETALPAPIPTASLSTPTAIPSTPTPTLTPTRTPAPTARPLTESKEVAGRYQNDLIGLTMQYPVTWQSTPFEEMGIHELLLLSPDEEIMLLMMSMDLGAEESLQDYFSEFADVMPSTFGLETFEWSSPGEWISLGENVDALQAFGTGTAVDSEDELYTEIIGAQRGNRVFWFIFIGLAESVSERQQVLDSLRQNIQIYLPRPYGVDRENALFLASGEPETLDPAKWEGSAGGIIGDIFGGLVQLDTNLQPVPDLADHWEVSPDGKIYTFHLRKDVVFHNGKPFTVQDVIFSWNRAVSPDIDSNTAPTYLGDISGVYEVIEGEASEINGLHKIDDFTLEVTLDAPKAYFLSKLSYPASWIVDSYTVSEIEERPNGTGPFKLVKHDENEVMILARNSNYHRGFVPLEYIVYLLYPGYPTRLYEAGEIDFTGIDEDLLDRAKDPNDPLFGTVYPETALCTSYFILDVSKPPFDDPLVRKAFALAVDKERYNEVVEEGKGVIAEGLFPPGLPGYNSDIKSDGYDPVKAREALDASTYVGSANLPEIVFTTSGAGTDLSPSDALVIQMWEETLGVKISVEQIDYDGYTDQLYAGEHGQIVSFGWCADYPDPENFADILFHTGSKQNIGSYSNPALDELLEKARSEGDVENRLSLYRQIEQTIVDDIPAIFIEHSRTYYSIWKPYVKGYVSTPIGVAQNMNLRIERED